MRQHGILLAGLLVLPGILAAQGSTPLPVGAVAPAFPTVTATTGGAPPRAFSLEEYRGRTVVLAFFYKARTSG